MISLDIKNRDPCIVLKVDDYVGSSIGPPVDYYDGNYEVIPKAVGQNLDTKGKTMRDDVSVAEIPLHEFSNESGGTTVVIGGIL